MLNTETSNLPSEQRQRLHADFLANEQSYLQMRAALLLKYRGQWVAIHQGQVIAAGNNLLAVSEAAATAGGHPYIAFVGGEESVVFRVRRAVFAYDLSYQPFPLPLVTVTFWNHAETHSQTYANVIPDTGADSNLPRQSGNGRSTIRVPHPANDYHERTHSWSGCMNQQRVLFDGLAGQVTIDP